MAFLRFSRDKRGYEHFYLVQPMNRRGKSRPRLLYFYRTPPNMRVGREPFDEAMRRALEAQNPGVPFDWRQIVATPIPSADAELWRERRRAERAARHAASEEEAAEAAEAAESPESIEAIPAPEPTRPEEVGASVTEVPLAAAPAVQPPTPSFVPSSDASRRRRRHRRGRRGQPVPSGQAAPQAQPAERVEPLTPLEPVDPPENID